MASSPKTLLRASHHGDSPTSPSFITTEEEGTLIAKPLEAPTGREREEGSNDSSHQRRKQLISVGRAPAFELLVGCDEAARLLGSIHVKTLQRYARQGTVPGYRIGGHWYFRITELDAWLRSRINSNCQSVR
jgi:excisionase family DNA binding protein